MRHVLSKRYRSEPERRRDAEESVVLNAFYWGMGNGLISTSLIIYFVYDLCDGIEDIPVRSVVAWIVAAPRIAGLLRLLTPTLMDISGSRKRLYVSAFACSPLVLLAIPLGVPRLLGHPDLPPGRALLLIVIAWCAYHVVEYFGTVSLWSLIGDLVPQSRRGRFLGRREAWMVFGRTLGFFFTGLYSFYVIGELPEGTPKWTGYLLPTYLGIFFLLAAVLPLLTMPEIPWKKEPLNIPARIRQLLQPLRSKKFAIFLFFGVWLQLPGLTQSLQHHYLARVLYVPLLIPFSMQIITQLGQCALGAGIGKWVDRLGHFRVMSVSIVLVSSGQMFYFFAEPSTWWLVFGAALVWIFWVGVNIGISSLVLNLSPPEQKAGVISVFYTFSTLAFALSTLIGGHIADSVRTWLFPIWFLGQETYWDDAHYGFFLGTFLRLSSIFVLYLALNVDAQPGENSHENSCAE